MLLEFWIIGRTKRHLALGDLVIGIFHCLPKFFETTDFIKTSLPPLQAVVKAHEVESDESYKCLWF